MEYANCFKDLVLNLFSSVISNPVILSCCGLLFGISFFNFILARFFE